MEIENRIKWKMVVVLILSIFIVAGLGYLTYLRNGGGIKPEPIDSTPEPTVEITAEPSPTPVIEETPVIVEEEKKEEPIDSLTYVVNKDHMIPADYVPSDLVALPETVRQDSQQYLRAECAEQIIRLFEDGIEQQIYYKLIHGYRSYEEIEAVGAYYIDTFGIDEVSDMEIIAGASEHQLGLAVDLGNWNSQCDLDNCYAWYPTYTYLVEHGYEYGLIERYPAGKENITGCEEMVYHWRYVGVEEATKIYNSGLTMEEYYGLTD